MRFRPEQHLRRQADFSRVRERGRREQCEAFTLWHVARPADEPQTTRAGFVASRAAVGGAVARNRAKRRLREVFRHHQRLAPPGHDLLLVARTALSRLAPAALERKFADACGKISPPAK